MAERANLFVIEYGRREMYYIHRGADYLEARLFWGPGHAVRFIRRGEPADESRWLDERQSDGGIVVDLDQRVLMFYGGSQVRIDVSLRRVYLQMLQVCWPGWDIRWAHEGVADIADYLGHSRESVLIDDWFDRCTSLSNVLGRCVVKVKEGDFVVAYGLGSIVSSERRVDYYPLLDCIQNYLGYGPELAEVCERQEGLSGREVNHWLRGRLPPNHFHINLLDRSLHWWSAMPVPGLPGRVRELWPGWKVEWHRDDFESYFASFDSDVVLSLPTKDELKAEIARILMCGTGESEAGDMLKTSLQDVANRKESTFDFMALVDQEGALSPEDRARVIAYAMSQV